MTRRSNASHPVERGAAGRVQPEGQFGAISKSAAAIALVFSLSACATPSLTPPPPPAAGGQPGAFSKAQLAPDRYHLTLVGGRMEPKEAVERTLLRRAAQLAVRQGYDWFVVTDQKTRVQPQLVAGPNVFMRPGFMWGAALDFYLVRPVTPGRAGETMGETGTR